MYKLTPCYSAQYFYYRKIKKLIKALISIINILESNSKSKRRIQIFLAERKERSNVDVPSLYTNMYDCNSFFTNEISIHIYLHLNKNVGLN